MQTTIQSNSFFHVQRPFYRACKVRLHAGLSYVAVLTIRVTACMLSIFGQFGKLVAIKLREYAERIYVIHVKHNLDYLAPLPILAVAKNRACPDVISQNEEIQAANKMRDQFILKNKLYPELIQKLQNIKFQGSKKGICFGATLWFLKSVLKASVTSEQQLISIAKSYEEGFPAEAASLHEIYGETLDQMNLNINRVFDQLYKKIEDASTEVEIEKFKQVSQKISDKIYQIIDVFQKAISALIGLRLENTNSPNDVNFLNFDTNEATRLRFDQLPQGTFQLGLRRCKHAISYLKFDFGSYLFDPNFGLMKCTSFYPSQDLGKLLQKYSKFGNPHNFELYQFCTANE